jgi:hypothetical protein
MNAEFCDFAAIDDALYNGHRVATWYIFLPKIPI